jgi:hypothetical protein
MSNCRYCGNEFNIYGLKNHEVYCELNPNRKTRAGSDNPNYGKVGKKGKNQYSNGSKMSEETRDKIKKSALGRKLSEDHINKIRSGMKKAVLENPESYSSSNVNGRVKRIDYKGITLDSKWEYEFVKWCDDNNVNWTRNKSDGFEYEYEGTRTYYPDFYLSDIGFYVEVKGYERDRDREKWKSVPNIIVIKKKEIEDIRKGIFNISACSSAGQ